MGNSQGGDFGNIFVRTEKPYFFSGELVTGTVYLNITKPGFPGQVVHLKIKGKEQCDWEEHRTISETDAEGRSQTRTEIDYYHGKNNFYSHKIPLYSFNGGMLPPGQYAFPFQFQLFAHLPGSFFEKGPEYKALIQYKIKAEIESFEKHTKKIKHTQELVVREPLKSNLQALQGEMRVKATVCCCCAKGESHIKCVFDKNHYLPGDNAFLWIDIDNSDCDLDVTTVRGTLTCNLTLRANTGREKLVTRAVVTQEIAGLPARSHAKDENRKTMQIQLVNTSARGDDDRYPKPSTSGQIVKNQYNLSATAILSGCTCCNSHPSVSVPINIVSPVPVSYDQVVQPSNWNPQTFQPVLVNFTDSNIYAKNPANMPQMQQQNQYMNQMNQPQMQQQY